MNTTRLIHYVDDDHDDLAIFKLAIDQLNLPFRLHTHSSPKEFLKIIGNECRENPLVFLDVNMPEKSGFELLNDIRKTIECKEVPVIMFSTSDDPRSIQVSQDLGASHYAVKPNSMGALKELIKKLSEITWGKMHVPQHEFLVQP